MSIVFICRHFGCLTGEGWDKQRKGGAGGGGGRGGEGRIFPSPPPPLSFSQSSSPLGSLLTRSSPLHVFLSKMAAVTRERRIIQPSRPTKYACTVGYIRSCFFNGKNQSSHLIHIFQTQGVRGHRHPRTPSPCHAPGK